MNKKELLDHLATFEEEPPNHERLRDALVKELGPGGVADLILKKPDFYSLLSEKALDNCREQELVIKEALQQGDYGQAAQAFHSLAGTVAIFGLEALRQKYLELEIRVQNLGHGGAPMDYDELQTLFDQQIRTLTALRSALEKHQ